MGQLSPIHPLNPPLKLIIIQRNENVLGVSTQRIVLDSAPGAFLLLQILGPAMVELVLSIKYGLAFLTGQLTSGKQKHPLLNKCVFMWAMSNPGQPIFAN